MSFIALDLIELDVSVHNKNELFDYICQKLFSKQRISSESFFKEALIKREQEITTGLGGYIAIPHAKDHSVIQPSLLYLSLKEGIEYQSLDGMPVKYVFVIAMPENFVNQHLKVLAQLAQLLLDQNIKNQIMNVKSKKEIYNLLSHINIEQS